MCNKILFQLNSKSMHETQCLFQRNEEEELVHGMNMEWERTRFDDNAFCASLSFSFSHSVLLPKFTFYCDDLFD